MESSESIPNRRMEPLESCAFHARLGAYHDGELSESDAAEVERHLRDCSHCQAELQEIRELSSLAAGSVSDEISGHVLRSIHRAVDADQSYSILRFAGMLTGLAASALVIGGVWLSDMPEAKNGGRIGVPVVVTAPPNSWQDVALNQSANSLPVGETGGQSRQIVVDAQGCELDAQWSFGETMMKSKTILFVMVLMFAVAVGAGVVAGKLSARIPAAPGKSTDQLSLVDVLHLNPQQQSQMQTIWEGVRKDSDDCLGEAQEAQKDEDNKINALLTEEQRPKYANLTMEYKRKVGEIQKRRDEEFHKAVSDSLKLMNPEQQQLYTQIVKDRIGQTPASGQAAGSP